jgi:hypothetical protein
MASHTFLSSGATASKQAPRFGHNSSSTVVDNLCTMTLTTTGTARILPQTQAVVVMQRCKVQKTSLAVLSNGSRIGSGQDVHI